jgi:hypothetical protein
MLIKTPGNIIADACIQGAIRAENYINIPVHGA